MINTTQIIIDVANNNATFVNIVDGLPVLPAKTLDFLDLTKTEKNKIQAVIDLIEDKSV